METDDKILTYITSDSFKCATFTVSTDMSFSVEVSDEWVFVFPLHYSPVSAEIQNVVP